MDSVRKEGAVLVTGASRGLGRSISMALNARGYRVFAGVRKPTDADSLRNASDGQISPIILDVTQMESVAAAFQVVSAEIGDTGLAGLVNMEWLLTQELVLALTTGVQHHGKPSRVLRAGES